MYKWLIVAEDKAHKKPSEASIRAKRGATTRLANSEKMAKEFFLDKMVHTPGACVCKAELTRKWQEWLLEPLNHAKYRHIKSGNPRMLVVGLNLLLKDKITLRGTGGKERQYFYYGLAWSSQPQAAA